MRQNQKLTHLIAGRSISGTSQSGDVLTVTLDDGAVLSIKMAPSNANTATTGGKVAKVQQQDSDLVFVLADGSSIDIKTADASSSVFMRDNAGKMAYAG